MSKPFMWCLRYAAPFICIASSCGAPRDELTFNTVTQTLPAPTTTTIAPSERIESLVASNTETTSRIVSDFSQIFELRAQCGRTPKQCPVQQMAIAGSPLFNSLRSIMSERIAGHLYTRTDAGKLRVRIESVEIVDPIHATLHTCIFDSVVLFDSGQIDSTTDDIVFDDSVISASMVWNVQRDHDTWKWVSLMATQRKIGADICGFAN
ncbi:MAG: hypothetical protein WCI10_03225 [Actinomycetota bacterium]